MRAEMFCSCIDIDMRVEMFCGCIDITWELRCSVVA